MSELLTADQAAKRLAVARRTLYRWHERREFCAVELPGRTLRWRASDIEALIAPATHNEAMRRAKASEGVR